MALVSSIVTGSLWIPGIYLRRHSNRDGNRVSTRSVATLIISGLLALTAPVFINADKVGANEYFETQCGQAVIGTYLATAIQTNTTAGQPTPYREIITLTVDGNFIANTSTAGGVPGSSNPVEQPFSPGQGTWTCTSNNEIVAKMLNFGFPSGTLPKLNRLNLGNAVVAC